MTDAAFKNCAKGNYHLARGGVLVNAGTTWDGYVAAGGDSETDLDRNPRKTGKYLDIGCYAAKAAGLLLFLR